VAFWPSGISVPATTNGPAALGAAGAAAGAAGDDPGSATGGGAPNSAAAARRRVEGFVQQPGRRRTAWRGESGCVRRAVAQHDLVVGELAKRAVNWAPDAAVHWRGRASSLVSAGLAFARLQIVTTIAVSHRFMVPPPLADDIGIMVAAVILSAGPGKARLRWAGAGASISSNAGSQPVLPRRGLRMKLPPIRFRYSTKLFLSHLLAVFLVSGSVGTFFYVRAMDNLMRSLQSRCRTAPRC
jgi:hypothetical protein